VVKWKDLDSAKIERFCRDQYSRYYCYPSLRDIFYAFVDDLWPNTLSAYQSLSKWLRDLRLSGRIDWRIIRDGSGREIAKGDYNLVKPENYIEAIIKDFEEAPDNYSLPKWLDQFFEVYILCEKEADFPVTRSILSNLNVDIAYLRGYSGWRLLFEIAEKIKRSTKEPVIIALGDFDPSGEDIVRFVREALCDLTEREISFLKIAVIKEQIEKFKLPHRPEDLREMQKLERDPRFKNWPFGHYRVETATLRVREPEYFERILREMVLEYFDSKIGKNVEDLERKLKKKVRRGLDKWRHEVF